jgi:hypothetical protein
MRINFGRPDPLPSFPGLSVAYTLARLFSIRTRCKPPGFRPALPARPFGPAAEPLEGCRKRLAQLLRGKKIAKAGGITNRSASGYSPGMASPQRPLLTLDREEDVSKLRGNSVPTGKRNYAGFGRAASKATLKTKH